MNKSYINQKSHGLKNIIKFYLFSCSLEYSSNFPFICIILLVSPKWKQLLACKYKRVTFGKRSSRLWWNTIHTSDSYSTRLIWYLFCSQLSVRLIFSDPIFWVFGGSKTLAWYLSLLFFFFWFLVFCGWVWYDCIIMANLIKIGSPCQKIAHLFLPQIYICQLSRYCYLAPKINSPGRLFNC